MTARNDSKNGSRNDKDASFSRRNLTTLLGVTGAAALIGCADRASPEQATEALAAAATIAGGVPNIAALRLRPGTDAEPYAVVLGYYQPDDGGGGLFYWSANATEPDNGGTIIAPTGTDVGRWKRVIGQPGIVDLAWFGATVGDGVGLANRLALTGALQLLAARGGGTLLVSKLYPLGDASDPSWLGIGVGLPPADGGVVAAAIDDLSIVATVAGAGFQFVRSTGAYTPAGLKLSGCRSLVLRGLTLDGSSQNTELVHLGRCISARVCGCTFQNALATFSLELIGGSHNTVENNEFGPGGGLRIGHVATAGDHEGDAHVVSNRFRATGQIAGNRVAAIQAAVRNGVISHNSFASTAGGIALLSDQLASEVCDALAIVGNTFVGCDYGILSLLGRGQSAPTQGLSIIGNTIEGAGGAESGWAPGIAIYSSNDLTITGNVLRDCDSAYALDLRSVTQAVVADNVVALTKPTAQVPPQQPWAIHVSIATTETRDVSISGNHVSGYAAGIGGGTNAGVTCSSISITGNTVTRLTGSSTLGMRVDPSTPGVSLVGNRVDPGGSYDYVLFSSCRMAGNSGKVTLFNDSTFFEESQGHHTFAPSVSPPASPPAGVSFETGDVVYHAAPRSGSNVGWVWTGSGWLPFGAIG